ncbi:GGDEF domain-containing protein [Sandaracinus amylolyticus]|uniref:GGDEF domain-containing protein n=1 Tax=Sandaracinus amylolyticus TaxID=927083 RepID=UPI001F019158|nr:GGDEF domain-containing protein [Sandaracinus amylolyticus]UJR80804.1 GGDEF domain-containing protein [Sandaracinus amylolyticus]
MSSRSASGPGGTVRLEDPTDFRAEVARAIKTRLAPVLVVIAGPDLGTSRRLDRTLTIGRAPDAGLSLADTSVSYLHARIEDRGDAWAVVDLGSTNGMRVDDLPCREAVLRPATKIQVGTTVLRFEVQDEDDQAYDEMLQRLISIDDLSGLFVRRRFDRELAQMITGARQASERVALLVMDLDGIKRINDTHGHLFGAHVIGEAGRRIARAIAGQVGAIACRFGGDEYLVAAPRLDTEGASALAEQLRGVIADEPYPKDGVELRVGVSIGLAVFPDEAADTQQLFQRADEAMYRAKQSGKNRVSR